MIYLPDTNAWIRFLNPGPSPVKGRFLAVDHSVIRLCSIVKAELYFGAMKGSRKNENLELLDALFAEFPSLPFGDDAALEYGRIRSLLARQGTPIGPNDLLIASIAIAYEAVLVTHNIREFSRIPHLKIEDWEK